MRVAGDEADAGEAAGDEVGEELVPGRGGLAGRDWHAQNLAAPVRIHPGGDQHDGVDDASAFTDLHGEGVGGGERERPRVPERAVAELVVVLVEVRGPAGDLRLGQRVDAEGLDEFVHATGGDAGEVAVGDHGDQRRFGALADSSKDHTVTAPTFTTRPATEQLHHYAGRHF